MPEGQIIKALSGFYYVLTNGEIYQCRGRGLFRKNKQTPLVGDHVVFDKTENQNGYITELLPRKNELVRPPIANIDQALIAVSVKEPAFSSKLLDRFLVIAEHAHVTPVILLTKMDLLTEEEAKQIDLYVKGYRAIGYHVKKISTQWQIDKEILTKLLENKTSVIAGQSGVGKSSFLNLIGDDLQIKTDDISLRLGRGKHTTRHVELIPILGGKVADTPGFSSLDFDQIELGELSSCFLEINQASNNCKFRGCSHINEPKCAVKEAVESGQIHPERYQHYTSFYEEIKSRKPRY